MPLAIIDGRAWEAASWPGEQRVGLLAGLVPLMREFGVSPVAFARESGVATARLMDRDATIPFAAMGRLFAAAKALTGRDDIGLQLGQRTDTLAALGVLGSFMRHAPDLGTALDDLARHHRRYVNGSVIYLLRGREEALFGYAVHRQAVEAIPQIIDAAMGAGITLLRGLGGAVPAEVQIARPVPADPALYRRALGVPVRFNAPQSALVIPRHQLGRAIPGADPRMRRRLEAQVAAWWPVRRPNIVSDVARVLLPRIAWGDTTLDATAALLSLHPRTLERRLRGWGTSYRALLTLVQLEVAGQLLRGTRMSAAAIGEALGYADPSAFGYWFRRATGESPARWRERAGPFSPLAEMPAHPHRPIGQRAL